jgi:transcriptional regulator with XRE-family HTH domain
MQGSAKAFTGERGDSAIVVGMPAGHRAPTARLRRLASELRRLRAASGLSREDVSERTGINPATLFRVETARARPQARTLLTLLDLYQVTDPARSELATLARQSAEQVWLQVLSSDLPEEYTAYISFEGEARSLLNYEGQFVPGLLQTEDYARAALRAGLPAASKEEIENLVQARISRQGMLGREDPPRLWVIVDEAVIRRRVGGPTVMRTQLSRLTEAADLPHVTFQVIPFDVGGHPGMAGAFVIMKFGEPAASEVVYIENTAVDLFLEQDNDLTRYNGIFEHLRALALPPEASVSLTAAAARQM